MCCTVGPSWLSLLNVAVCISIPNSLLSKVIILFKMNKASVYSSLLTITVSEQALLLSDQQAKEQGDCEMCWLLVR